MKKSLIGCFMLLLLVGFMAGCGSGGRTDNTAPAVISTTLDPANGATDVPINTKITATFSEAMDPLTVTTATFTVQDTTAAGAVAGAVTYDPKNHIATFTPTSNLAANHSFDATITIGAKGLAGNMAANSTRKFTTGEAADNTAPTVNPTDPANGATGVPINRKITATFSEAMDPSTITTATFTVQDTTAGVPVTGAVTYDAKEHIAAFTPTDNLKANHSITATITSGAKDLAGNALTSNEVWNFTTSEAAAAGPAPVVLGTASNFVILAKTGVSTTGTTAVVGDIGLSPAARTYITGFSEALDATNVFATSSLVTGKLYAANMAVPTPANMTTAISDMETAFIDAAGRSLPDHTELGAGDISGRTLAPGLYKWGTGVLITSGVTLSGGANDVWIFQIAQDLTVANGAIITLSGGAQAKNIFWQVSGKTTLGTTSDFKGIILCQTKIVLQTGAKLSGRALAQTAVTLDANNVTQPAP